MKKLSLLLLVLLLFSYCKKESTNNSIVPPPGDTTTFAIPATGNIVMYEVNLRAYSPAGNLQGVTDRLEQIKDLGINVIWLMPIYPIGQLNSINSPYCIRNYKEVNPELGTMGDLQNLVKQAHKKGMAVILDWVANHTAWDNPWIANKDWYTQDGNGNIVHPPGTNWEDVADLNYDSQEMRLAMIDAMKYWIKSADIDGYRCDAADMVPFDFWKQAIDSVNGLKDRLIWLAEGARADHFTAGFQMNYAWDFYSKIKDVFKGTQPATSLITANTQEYVNIPAGKHKLRFTTNHDESAWNATPMVLFNGEQGALAASVATIFLDGVPLIYGSQEVGQVANVPFFSNNPIDWSQHPEMLQAYKDLFKVYEDLGNFKADTLTSYSNASVLAFICHNAQEHVLIIDNLRNNLITYAIPAGLGNSVWKDELTGSNMTLPESLDLAAYQYFILKN